jgi:hypothetical protein
MFLNQLKVNDLDTTGCVTGTVRRDGRGNPLIKKRRIQGEANEVYMCVSIYIYMYIYAYVYVCIHIKSN